MAGRPRADWHTPAVSFGISSVCRRRVTPRHRPKPPARLCNSRGKDCFCLGIFLVFVWGFFLLTAAVNPSQPACQPAGHPKPRSQFPRAPFSSLSLFTDRLTRDIEEYIRGDIERECCGHKLSVRTAVSSDRPLCPSSAKDRLTRAYLRYLS